MNFELVLAKVPLSHSENLIITTETPSGYRWSRHGFKAPDGHVADGLYRDGTIHLFSESWTWEFSLLHEVGHHFIFKFNIFSDIYIWIGVNAIIDKLQDASYSKLVALGLRKYSLRDAGEFMAEAYALRILRPYTFMALERFCEEEAQLPLDSIFKMGED